VSRVGDGTEAVRQPLPVDKVDVVGRRRSLTDKRTLGDARLAYRRRARRLVRLDGEHSRPGTHQVVARPQRLSVRHLTVVSQSQLLADPPLYRQPRPEPGARQLPRPRSILAVAAAWLRARRRSVDCRCERLVGLSDAELVARRRHERLCCLQKPGTSGLLYCIDS